MCKRIKINNWWIYHHHHTTQTKTRKEDVYMMILNYPEIGLIFQLIWKLLGSLKNSVFNRKSDFNMKWWQLWVWNLVSLTISIKHFKYKKKIYEYTTIKWKVFTHKLSRKSVYRCSLTIALWWWCKSQMGNN